MPDASDSSKIQIDSDWKMEAQREKERLAAEEQKAGAHAKDLPDPSFLEIINLIAMQAAIGLGGFAGPGGERIPADPMMAKHHIDMLEVLAKKTAGNLAEDEKKVLDGVLYELRMRFVEIFAGQPTGAPQSYVPSEALP